MGGLDGTGPDQPSSLCFFCCSQKRGLFAAFGSLVFGLWGTDYFRRSDVIALLSGESGGVQKGTPPYGLLYMPAFVGALHWNPALMALYQRLIARGKSHKCAIVACMRKLLIFANTVVARGTPWETNGPITIA